MNWIAGVVHSELPGLFRQSKAAETELAWCLDHADRAPHAGWLREVDYHLGKAGGSARGERAQAEEYPTKERLQGLEPAHHADDTLFRGRRHRTLLSLHGFVIAAILPGRVYVLTGFEFTEYYFVVSENRRELIGIDAGTRPDSAKTAYEGRCGAQVPGLPPLTTIFITHYAHWDPHVGRPLLFRGLESAPAFLCPKQLSGRVGPAKWMRRGTFDDKQFFRVNASTSKTCEASGRTSPSPLARGVKIGGTRIELIPIRGGETHDAMFIHLPDLGVMFVGDFIMPYLGAPFVEEGDFQGLLDAIDILVAAHPQYLLHLVTSR